MCIASSIENFLYFSGKGINLRHVAQPKETVDTLRGNSVRKSNLQKRAEAARERFRDARKPIVIEFAGVPKSGKTSTISQIQSFFKRCGFRVQVVVERASVCPVRDKKHFTFNVWTLCTTLANILEKTQEPPKDGDPDILILDRGLFDAISWLTVMENLSRIRPSDREIIERFLMIDEWRKRLTCVIVMTVNPNDAMKREEGLLPVVAEGSIMNTEVLDQMLNTTRQCIARLKDKFPITEIDTSGADRDGPRKSAEKVATTILDYVERDLLEEILYLRKDQVTSIFKKNVLLTAQKTKLLIERYSTQGKYDPRRGVEDDLNLVQALPVVVVRDRSGRILCLRRKERKSSDRLNKKFVIWAGGHVRREDSSNGNPIVCAVLRELNEELRLNIEKKDLEVLGALYIQNGRSAQHVAIVYEWKASKDDVAISISASEFYERRGTSLSGTFMREKDLPPEIFDEANDPWSSEIATKLLKLKSSQHARKLF